MRRKGRRRGIGRVLLRMMAVVVSIAVFCTLCYSLWERHQRLMEVEQEIEQLNQEIEAELERQAELETLRDRLQDPAYIELLARQELGLIRPDDVPYNWNRRR